MHYTYFFEQTLFKFDIIFMLLSDFSSTILTIQTNKKKFQRLVDFFYIFFYFKHLFPSSPKTAQIYHITWTKIFLSGMT